MKKIITALFFCLIMFSAMASAQNTTHQSDEYGFSFQSAAGYTTLRLLEKGVTPDDGMFFARHILVAGRQNLPPVIITLMRGNLFPEGITFANLFDDRKTQKKFTQKNNRSNPDIKQEILGEKTAGQNRFLKLKHTQTDKRKKSADHSISYISARQDELVEISFLGGNLTSEQNKLIEENIALIIETLTWPEKLSGQTAVKQDMAKKRIDYRLDNVGLVFSTTEQFCRLRASRLGNSAVFSMIDSHRQTYPALDIWGGNAPKEQAAVSYSQDKYSELFQKEVTRPDALTDTKYSRLFARRDFTGDYCKFIVTILELGGKKDFTAKTIENGRVYTIHTAVAMGQADKHPAVEENFYLALKTFQPLEERT